MIVASVRWVPRTPRVLIECTQSRNIWMPSWVAVWRECGAIVIVLTWLPANRFFSFSFFVGMRSLSWPNRRQTNRSVRGTTGAPGVQNGDIPFLPSAHTNCILFFTDLFCCFDREYLCMSERDWERERSAIHWVSSWRKLRETDRNIEMEPKLYTHGFPLGKNVLFLRIGLQSVHWNC